jgi:hypothetical protein
MKKTDRPSTATEAQINANGGNAGKSTGTHTVEGKAASSRNGLTHGLCANKHILPGEDPEEFLFLLKDLFARFHPVGQGEEKLVLRIAAGQWRLGRAFRMKAAYRGEPLPPPLARCESAIERSIGRCLRQLKAFQAARNTPGPGGKAPAPPKPTPKVPPSRPPRTQ